MVIKLRKIRGGGSAIVDYSLIMIWSLLMRATISVTETEQTAVAEKRKIAICG